MNLKILNHNFITLDNYFDMIYYKCSRCNIIVFIDCGKLKISAESQNFYVYNSELNIDCNSIIIKNIIE